MTEIEKAIQEFEDNAYHNSLHPEISGKSKAVALAALLAQREIEKNEPLTLDELREMDGEPVWVERPDGYKSYNGWALVDVSWKAQSVIYLACAHGSTTLCVSLLHSGGKVYRYKPKEA